MGNVLIKSILPLNVKLADMPTLESDCVHLYQISLIDQALKLSELQALLSPGELVKADRYLRKQDRDRFILSKGALRVILSSYTAVAPVDMQFDVGPGKKPLIRNKRSVFFNVSHSLNWVLIAVSNKEVGVDVEFVNPDFSTEDIVREYFSSDEVNYLSDLNADLTFFELWTRKEAFLKATGQGIGEHLKFTPSLNGVHQLDTSLDGSDRDWKVLSFKLNSDYACAVASGFDRIFLVEYAFNQMGVQTKG